MLVPSAPPTAFMISCGPSAALEMSTQRLPQTVVAFFVTCGCEDALAAPAAARPRDVLIAADAATRQSPLVKRLRMVIPSCGLLGRPPSRWHGRSSSAGRGLVDVGCYSLLSRPVSQWSSP